MGAIQDAPRRMKIKTVVESPAPAAAIAGVLVEVRTGRPVAEEPVGCEVTPAEGEGLEGRVQLVFFCG